MPDVCIIVGWIVLKALLELEQRLHLLLRHLHRLQVIHIRTRTVIDTTVLRHGDDEACFKGVFFQNSSSELWEQRTVAVSFVSAFLAAEYFDNGASLPGLSPR